MSDSFTAPEPVFNVQSMHDDCFCGRHDVGPAGLECDDEEHSWGQCGVKA